MKIYDKALEQGEPGHWIRVELVMRHENAQAFGQKLTNSESVGRLAAQVINDKFSFIDRDDSNISRKRQIGTYQQGRKKNRQPR